MNSGRDEKEITLVAVSKTFSEEHIESLYELGHRDFGENKVQELTAKREILKELNISWHMIGHLQSNKVKYIADFISLIHSVDSFKLAKEIDKHAAKNKRKVPLLIQVNTSREDSKSGTDLENVNKLAEEAASLQNIEVLGLMTISALTEDKEIVKKNFESLHSKYKELKEKYNYKYLSMGMTDDYKLAIAQGANMIRIGSAIFGKRN